MEIILPFLLGIGIMYWMYRQTNWHDFITILIDMKWGWMLFSFVFGILAQVLRALRWRQTYAPLGLRPRITSCIDAIYVSYAASLVIPRIGEVMRCGLLKRSDEIPFTQSLGTVVTERMVDAMVMFVVCGLTFLTQIPLLRIFLNRMGTNIAEVLHSFTTTGYLVTVICAIALVILAVLLFIRLSVFARVRTKLTALWQGMASLTRIKQRWLYLFYSVGIWICYYLHFYIAFFCFPFTATLSPMVALMIFCVGSFAVLVPTPNGAGSWHFAVKTMLIIYGVAAEPAILFALAVHTLQTGLVVVLGVYGYLGLMLRSKHHGTLCTTTDDNTY